MKYILPVVASICLSLSGTAFAQRAIQYNYGEFRFILDSDLDTAGVDGDGFGFGGSIRLDELFYVVADYEDLDYDRNIDTSVLQLGLGVIVPVQRLDAIAELAILDSEVETASDDDSDTGYRLTGGLRGYVTPDLELRATINRVDVDDEDTFFTLAGDYFLNDWLSVNVARDFSADVERFSIGVRYYLGE